MGKIAGITLATLAALAGAAHAGAKPTAAEAKQTVTAWLAAWAAADGDDAAAPAVVKLMTTPFYAVAYDPTGMPACAEQTATTPVAIAKTFECLRDALATDGATKTWSKKVERSMEAPQVLERKLKGLAKTATLVMHESECAGEGYQVIFAVTKAKDGALAVSAVAGVSTFCGE